MLVYFTDDTKITKAVVMQYNGNETARYTQACKHIELSSLPEPDQSDLMATVQKIISDERKRKNFLNHSDLFILYPRARYLGLKDGRLKATAGNRDYNPAAEAN